MNPHIPHNISLLFGKPVRIFLYCHDTALVEQLTALWPAQCTQWEMFSSGRHLLERVFAEPPQLIICAVDTHDANGLEIVRLVKSENVFRQVCAVLALDRQTLGNGLDWNSVEVEDFLLLPASPEEMRARLELALQRSTRTLDANPLTRLPGNASIMQYIDRALHTQQYFALAYVDIDHFKAFNDKYGFLRGDEILLMTARILVSCVMGRDAPAYFVGHIGGDDFVFTLPFSHMEETCQSIIDAFEAIVPSFYDDVDREHGCIVSKDRQGARHTFPLLSLSIAVVANHGNITHFGQLSHAAGQLKSVAKARQGSCFIIDRRQH